MAEQVLHVTMQKTVKGPSGSGDKTKKKGKKDNWRHMLQ